MTVDIPDTTADPGRLEAEASDFTTLAAQIERQSHAVAELVTGCSREFSEPVSGRIYGEGRRQVTAATPLASAARTAAQVTTSWARAVRQYKRIREALLRDAANPNNSAGVNDEIAAEARSLRTWFEGEARSHGTKLANACHGVTLRLLDLNIGQGAGNVPWPLPTSDKGTDPQELRKIAVLIANGGADVVTLQEVFKRELPKLEKMLEQITGEDWTFYFGRASMKTQRGNRPGDTWPDQDFGNAILVRGGAVLSSGPLGSVNLAGPGADEGRSLVGVRLNTAGGPVDIYTTHVAEDKPEYDAEQTNQINNVWQNVGNNPRAVITGDFNEALDQPPAKEGERSHGALGQYRDHGYTDAGNAGRTSVNGTGRRIDYVFTGGDIEPGKPAPVDGRPSDHNGVTVDLTVPYQGP
jgi:endonuclease/exonuclease/phosphatase family metal-dependent hydrolase